MRGNVVDEVIQHGGALIRLTGGRHNFGSAVR